MTNATKKINVRTKGQTGEREIAKMLNEVTNTIRTDRGLPQYLDKDLPFQRNQMQSAVGGHDLSNPLGLAIEVKRQESLSINTWWKQCVESATRFGGIPILIYRQNRRPWRVVMPCEITTGLTTGCINARIEIELETFLQWFTTYYIGCLSHGLTDWRTERTRKAG